jgi:hypothetical protein
MKKYIFGVIFALFLTTNAVNTYAQVLVTRYANYTLASDTVEKMQIFPSVSAVLQNSRGYLSRNDDLAWGAFLTESAVFLRKKKNFLIFQALQEVNADIYNDIGFNPKISTWMEEFFYGRKIRNGQLLFGLQHRSKHDIDNGEPAVRDTSLRFLPNSRVVILNGPYFSAQKKFDLTEKLSTKFLLRYEYFTVHYDSRFPYGNYEQSWRNARMSVLANWQIEQKIRKHWAVYMLNWVNPVYFVKQTPFKFNFRSEVGLQLLGEKANGRVFVAYEHFFDHLYRPFPVANGTLWFGTRVSGKNYW